MGARNAAEAAAIAVGVLELVGDRDEAVLETSLVVEEEETIAATGRRATVELAAFEGRRAGVDLCRTKKCGAVDRK